MEFKFKVGDKVRVLKSFSAPQYNGEVGEVTQLLEGGEIFRGAVVTNEKFISRRPKDFGEHGYWFYADCLELVS